MFFKPLQYTDVGQPQRPAAFKRYPDLRAVDGGRGPLLAQAYERRTSRQESALH